MVAIFDLDGTLANCEHRRHFVDPSKDPRAWQYSHNDWRLLDKYGEPCTKNKWKPDWKAFYEACDQDTPIKPVINMFWALQEYDHEIEIWSGRCESVREKTAKWIMKHILSNESFPDLPFALKMRPIGDNTPDDQLKEKWLDERCKHLSLNLETGITTKDCHNIDFLVDDRPKVVRMWRRRGIFVFDVNQSGKEF